VLVDKGEGHERLLAYNLTTDRVSEDLYMVSVRNFDRVTFINRTTDEVELTLGADGRHDVLYEQHNPDHLRGPDGEHHGRPMVVVLAEAHDDVAGPAVDDDDLVEVARRGQDVPPLVVDHVDVVDVGPVLAEPAVGPVGVVVPEAPLPLDAPGGAVVDEEPVVADAVLELAHVGDEEAAVRHPCDVVGVAHPELVCADGFHRFGVELHDHRPV